MERHCRWIRVVVVASEDGGIGRVLCEGVGQQGKELGGRHDIVGWWDWYRGDGRRYEGGGHLSWCGHDWGLRYSAGCRVRGRGRRILGARRRAANGRHSCAGRFQLGGQRVFRSLRFRGLCFGCQNGLDLSQAFLSGGRFPFNRLRWRRRRGFRGRWNRFYAARSYRAFYDLVARRGLSFLFRWWWWCFELTEEVVKASAL